MEKTHLWLTRGRNKLRMKQLMNKTLNDRRVLFSLSHWTSFCDVPTVVELQNWTKQTREKVVLVIYLGNTWDQDPL